MQNLDFDLCVCVYHENRKEIISRKKESLKEWGGENEAKIHEIKSGDTLHEEAH